MNGFQCGADRSCPATLRRVSPQFRLPALFFLLLMFAAQCAIGAQVAGPLRTHSGVGDAAEEPLPTSIRRHRSASPLTYNFLPVGRLSEMLAGALGPEEKEMGQRVMAGFRDAGDVWRVYLRDEITINVEVDFGPQGNRGLGSSLADDEVFLYADVARALADDVRPVAVFDALAVANLQEGPLEFITNDTTIAGGAPRMRDNDRTGNNLALNLSRANAKALGLIPAHEPQRDLQLVFSDLSDFVAAEISWDFDATDGVGVNEYDFVAVAAHELAHGMGFLSGVDLVDLFSDPGGSLGPTQADNPTDLDEFAVFTVLDLFRYSRDSLSRSNQPVGGLNDWAYGRAAPDDIPFFSIDGGQTELATFATGRFNGDGHQASHWQDDLGIGLLDPSTIRGQMGLITPLDVIALDVIGFDAVPEPALVGWLLLALACPLRRRDGRLPRAEAVEL